MAGHLKKCFLTNQRRSRPLFWIEIITHLAHICTAPLSVAAVRLVPVPRLIRAVSTHEFAWHLIKGFHQRFTATAHVINFVIGQLDA